MRLLLLDLVDDGARYILRGVVSIAAFPVVLDERLCPRPCPIESLSEREKRFVTGLCGQARRNGTSDLQRCGGGKECSPVHHTPSFAVNGLAFHEE